MNEPTIGQAARDGRYQNVSTITEPRPRLGHVRHINFTTFSVPLSVQLCCVISQIAFVVYLVLTAPGNECLIAPLRDDLNPRITNIVALGMSVTVARELTLGCSPSP